MPRRRSQARRAPSIRSIRASPSCWVRLAAPASRPCLRRRSAPPLMATSPARSRCSMTPRTASTGRRWSMRPAQLIAPAEDNARFYIESARTLAPEDARVVEAVRDLIARLESEARQALAAHSLDAADSWTTAVAEVGADAAQVTDLRKQVEELRAATSAETRSASGQRALEEARNALARHDPEAAGHWLAEARGAGADAATITALESQAQAAASTSREPAETYVNENMLVRTHYVAPQYPQDAQRRGIDGWVELHFVVNEDGTVSAPAVVAAQPAGLFEQAALAAITQWRYQPAMQDGRPVSRRAQLRIRFKVR